MAIIPRDEETMLAEARRWLRENTEFTNFSPGSLVWNLVELPVRELGRLWRALAELESSLQLDTATGQSLDRLGELLGLTRKLFQPANTLDQAAGFKFYVVGGQTYGEASGGGTAIIPAGTPVWPHRNPGQVYHTTQDANFEQDTREVFVPIVAQESGSRYNVGPGQLDRHGAVEQAGLVYCTNLHAIDNGSDLEGDEPFRYRISQRVQQIMGWSSVSLAATALGVPGVRDVLVHEFARGTGTVDLTVLTYFPQTSQSILAQVRAELERVRPEGIDVQVYGPIERRIDLSLQLVPSSLEAGLRTQVRQALVSYLNLLTLGEPFIVNELIQRAMEVSETIQDLVLLELYVEDRSGQRVPCLFTNQLAEPDEKFYAGQVTVL